MKGSVFAGWVYIPRLVPSLSLLYLSLSDPTTTITNNSNMSNQVLNSQSLSMDEQPSQVASNCSSREMSATPSHSKLQFTKAGDGSLSCTYEGKTINP
jgi:hypothetical protein